MTPIHVVAGVVIDERGQILIAQRAAHQHQGGLWEFPGGKVEPGEEAQDALSRELAEELGIKLQAASPLIQIQHHYPDKTILLDVWRVTRFSGQAWGREGQPLCWVNTEDLANFSFPAANEPILKALKTPQALAITGQAHNDSDWLVRCAHAIDLGAKALLVRSTDDAASLIKLVPQANLLCQKAGIPLLLNSGLAPLEQLLSLPCDGIHLRQADWLHLNSRPIPKHYLLSLACHSAEQVAAVESLDADFLLLSPVESTLSHPDAEPLGWAHFASLCRAAKTPVLALGGVGKEDITKAQAAGAQGIAGIRCFWPD